MIQKIINLWEEEGTKSMKLEGKMMYKHPEFMYRKSGEWKGWSDFLGCPESANTNYRDTMETIAFNIITSKN
jgi:hypothetical protein|tara:strand:+ start:20 stop:235 length:216 start_codon:yes stop_codon:yes gene_type:complete